MYNIIELYNKNNQSQWKRWELQLAVNASSHLLNGHLNEP